jgi:hypothetical protein
MAEKLIWNLTVRAEGGPQLNGSATMPVEAYDKISVSVPKGNTEFKVSLGSGVAALVILPAKPSVELTYKVGANWIKLDQPTFLFGGAVALAGNPQELVFKNNDGEDAAVQILTGRDATPTPP